MSKHLGAGVSSAHSLASDTSEGTCHARSSHAAARARNQSAASSASSPSASVPKEVVTTRLYKCGRLIEY